jgi:predicted DNA-binding transcriptional regulator YafY
MRADRLISLLILLQTRGTLTARTLAEELEVSERTVYRDIQALSVSGIPVYAERGPGGGVSLVEGYRTSLTGLTEAERRALFMLSVPQPLAELGVGQELKAALLKLTAALPGARRGEDERARQRIYLDAVPWSWPDQPTSHLQILYQAVWDDRCLRLTYRMFLGALVELTVAPYSLVAKASAWHLVYAYQGKVRALPLSSIVAAQILEDRFERPADFDLAMFWQAHVAEWESARLSYPVTVRVAPGLIPFHRQVFGDGAHCLIQQADPPDETGWMTLALLFESLEAARERLLGLGGAVEVLEPLALRLSVADFAAQTVAQYQAL